LFRCLADKNLQEDVRGHLNVFFEGIRKDEEYDLLSDKTFQSLLCKLLIIGQGMDDYAKQFLLNIRSARIYLVIHNISK
ncbi:unnamed protein product, partial [Rotaria sp. Silwood2]